MSFDILLTLYGEFNHVSQSLSSRAMSFDEVIKTELREFRVSIPFEQGNVFRQYELEITKDLEESQSLSSRAMSFDCSGMLEAGIMRPFRPTSQFFGRLRSWLLN